MKKLLTVLLALSLVVSVFAVGSKEKTASNLIELELYYYKQENQEGS